MDTVLTLIMLAVFILGAAAVSAWRRGARLHAALMAIIAVIGLVNLGFWTLPDDSGAAPITKLHRQDPGR